MWSCGDWIKNLVLFFDGIALLVPNYMKRRPEEVDPAIVAGLKQHGLLEIIEPEKAVDKSATEKLAMAMTDLHYIRRARRFGQGADSLRRTVDVTPRLLRR